jgi:hypothetical protein
MDKNVSVKKPMTASYNTCKHGDNYNLACKVMMPEQNFKGKLQSGMVERVCDS